MTLITIGRCAVRVPATLQDRTICGRPFDGTLERAVGGKPTCRQCIRMMETRSNPATSGMPPSVEAIVDDGDTVLDYDHAQGEDFYHLYDVVYTKRRPTDGEIEEVAGLLLDTGVFVVMSGETRGLSSTFSEVAVDDGVAYARGPKAPEKARINAEMRRNRT
jgi:hypothetical protein